MLVEILLISEADVTNFSAMGGNIQFPKYRQDLIWIQQTSILPLLGKKLYEKIELGYTENSLEGKYKEIWKYCRNILSRFIAYEHGKVANYNLMNGGVYKIDNNGRETVEKKEVDFLAQDQKMKGLDYVELLRLYLCENKEDLKGYDLKGCGCVPKNPTAKYQMDWYLGK